MLLWLVHGPFLAPNVKIRINAHSLPILNNFVALGRICLVGVWAEQKLLSNSVYIYDTGVEQLGIWSARIWAWCDHNLPGVCLLCAPLAIICTVGLCRC